jgi:hypothetical protein
LFKHIPAPRYETGGTDPLRFHELELAAEEETRRARLDPEYYVGVDDGKYICYKDITGFLRQEEEPEDIWVWDKDKPPGLITNEEYECRPLRSLVNKELRPRGMPRTYVLDEQIRDRVKAKLSLP